VTLSGTYVEPAFIPTKIILRTATTYAAEATPEPFLDLRPFRWNNPERANLNYATQIVYWARSQPLPKYDLGRTPGPATHVEEKLLDAISVVSTVPDSNADSFARMQSDARAKLFEQTYKAGILALLVLKPMPEFLQSELRRYGRAAIEPTAVGDGTSAAREYIINELGAELADRMDRRVEYAREIFEKRMERGKEGAGVDSSIVANLRESLKNVQIGMALSEMRILPFGGGAQSQAFSFPWLSSPGMSGSTGWCNGQCISAPFYLRSNEDLDGKLPMRGSGPEISRP
jgi:hypothetical protein